MEKEMKERSSESHPSSLEDGRVVTDFDKVKFCQSCGMPLTDDVLGTNTFSLRVAHYKTNPKASIYFCDAEGFKGMMLRGTMEVLTDAESKKMIWREGDTQYYPGGVTDPNYCVLKFTATDGRFYSDFYPRSFVL